MLLNDNPTGGLPSCELLAREASEAPQAIKAVAAVVGKSLLLKTLYVHALISGHGEIKLG